MCFIRPSSQTEDEILKNRMLLANMDVQQVPASQLILQNFAIYYASISVHIEDLVKCTVLQLQVQYYTHTL